MSLGHVKLKLCLFLTVFTCKIPHLHSDRRHHTLFLLVHHVPPDITLCSSRSIVVPPDIALCSSQSSMFHQTSDFVPLGPSLSHQTPHFIPLRPSLSNQTSRSIVVPPDIILLNVGGKNVQILNINLKLLYILKKENEFKLLVLS